MAIHTIRPNSSLFETAPKAYIVEFLREAGFFNLIWMTIYPENLLM